VETHAFCVTAIEQFSSPAEEFSSCIPEVVDTGVTDSLDVSELATVDSLDGVTLETLDVLASRMALEAAGVGVGVGVVDGFSVGMAEGLVGVGVVDGFSVGMAEGLVGVGVAVLLLSGVVFDFSFALASKRGSIAAFSATVFRG
jgi:hypothetical protein